MEFQSGKKYVVSPHTKEDVCRKEWEDYLEEKS